MQQAKSLNIENIQNMLGIIKYPVISDKATRLLESNKYTFMIDRKANKFIIKKVIEYFFSVNVIKINTLNTAPQKKTVGRFSGYKSRYKKAIITLKKGDKINLFPDI